MTNTQTDYQKRVEAHQVIMDSLHKPKINAGKILPLSSDIEAINRVLDGRCPYVREQLEKLEHYPMQWEDGTHLFPSSRIDIFEDIKPQFYEAMLNMKSFMRILKRMEIEIEIKNISWHNVPDMTENIMGNLGYFIIMFSIKKESKNENATAL